MMAAAMDWFDLEYPRREICPKKGCWIATKNLNGKGYSCYRRRDGTYERLHRLSYKKFKGPIPDGMVVCHECDVRNCWNPDHLFLGTVADNNIDMMRKGRLVLPPNVQVTPDSIVREIRRRFDLGETSKAISASLGMKCSTVYYIASRRNRKHVEDIAR